ncbi:MAG TPA: exopolysaccharide biosynthesis polyprenyl glycosylphosphotransferase [Chthonomonadaceae bacterium]|nr:exopolysaccharide biosynthesis polyprenyl glycosylphosphotransferase [Chthonomonadaceae bacterium]
MTVMRTESASHTTGRTAARPAVPEVVEWMSPSLQRRTIPIRSISYAPAKRSLDVALALLGLLVCAPLFVLIALMVKRSSRGPVIFKQTRVGQGGRLFTCYKFRSMYIDAERRREQLRAHNEVSGPVFKIKRDPRITPAGRLLRKLSLDELPQLFNVLKGDMSLVGPRPPIPEEVALYDQREQGRLAVKPGLTCIWQISGRSDLDFARWVELDLEYIDTMSFWQDLAIIARTIPAVLSTRGAY